LRLITHARATTFPRIAFIVGIFARRNGPANAIETLTLARFGTRTAHRVTYVAATKAIHAIPRQTLVLVDAWNAIVLFAHALAVTRSAPAFFVGVFVIGNCAAHAVYTLVFLGRRTSLTRPQTPTVATDAVGTKTRRALCSRRTHSSICCRYLRSRARSRAGTFAGIALVVRIGIYRNASAHPIATSAFFRRRTCLARAHANIPAAKTIHAIVRQTLRRRCARKTIVVLAHVFTVATAVRAIVIRIGIVFDRSANAVYAASLFGRAARHAFVVAFVVATETVDAITRGALRTQCACSRIRWRRDELGTVCIVPVVADPDTRHFGIRSRFIRDDFDTAQSPGAWRISTGACFRSCEIGPTPDHTRQSHPTPKCHDTWSKNPIMLGTSSNLHEPCSLHLTLLPVGNVGQASLQTDERLFNKVKFEVVNDTRLLTEQRGIRRGNARWSMCQPSSTGGIVCWSIREHAIRREICNLSTHQHAIRAGFGRLSTHQNAIRHGGDVGQLTSVRSEGGGDVGQLTSVRSEVRTMGLE